MWPFKKKQERIVIIFSDDGGVEIKTEFSTEWFKKVAAMNDDDKQAYTYALNALVQPLTFMGHVVNTTQDMRDRMKAEAMGGLQ